MPSPAPAPWADYRRRTPETEPLYQVLAGHLETFLERTRASDRQLPAHVECELGAYLECGILACGFVRLRCQDCGHSRAVAFPCKRRGFCPSCLGRRMADTAARLTDQVLPHAPVRQWILSLPLRHPLSPRLGRRPGARRTGHLPARRLRRLARGIDLEVAQAGGRLVCELKVPLARDEDHPYGLGIRPGQQFSLGFETATPDREAMRERRGDAAQKTLTLGNAALRRPLPRPSPCPCRR
jgi:hypothetical protein